MSECPDHAGLVTYLYGEDPPAVRARVEAHLAACPACAAEVRALAGVRGALGAWTPPGTALGFRIVSEADAPAVAGAPESGAGGPAAAPPPGGSAPARWRVDARPIWGLALAATLVIVAAAAVARIDVQYGDDGVAVRIGWSPLPAPAAATGRGAAGRAAAAAGVTAGAARPSTLGPGRASPAPPAAADSEADRRRDPAAGRPGGGDLAARAAALRTAVAARRIVGARRGPAPPDDALRQEMLALIAESERRQQDGLAWELIGLAEEFRRLRRPDRARVPPAGGGAADYRLRVAQPPDPDR